MPFSVHSSSLLSISPFAFAGKPYAYPLSLLTSYLISYLSLARLLMAGPNRDIGRYNAIIASHSIHISIAGSTTAPSISLFPWPASYTQAHTHTRARAPFLLDVSQPQQQFVFQTYQSHYVRALTWKHHRRTFAFRSHRNCVLSPKKSNNLWN